MNKSYFVVCRIQKVGKTKNNFDISKYFLIVFTLQFWQTLALVSNLQMYAWLWYIITHDRFMTQPHFP